MAEVARNRGANGVQNLPFGRATSPRGVLRWTVDTLTLFFYIAVGATFAVKSEVISAVETLEVVVANVTQVRGYSSCLLG